METEMIMALKLIFGLLDYSYTTS